MVNLVLSNYVAIFSMSSRQSMFIHAYMCWLLLYVKTDTVILFIILENIGANCFRLKLSKPIVDVPLPSSTSLCWPIIISMHIYLYHHRHFI